MPASWGMDRSPNRTPPASAATKKAHRSHAAFDSTIMEGSWDPRGDSTRGNAHRRWDADSRLQETGFGEGVRSALADDAKVIHHPDIDHGQGGSSAVP